MLLLMQYCLAHGMAPGFKLSCGLTLHPPTWTGLERCMRLCT